MIIQLTDYWVITYLNVVGREGKRERGREGWRFFDSFDLNGDDSVLSRSALIILADSALHELFGCA